MLRRRLRDLLTGLRSGPKSVVAQPLCAECSKTATLVELVPPGRLPHDFRTWPENLRALYEQHYGRNTNWHLIVEGVDAGNGIGDDIDEAEAARIARAFAEPYTFAKVHTAGLWDDAGFCEKCDAAYCYAHWHNDKVGQFRCPHGHWKSLDPHWSPD